MEVRGYHIYNVNTFPYDSLAGIAPYPRRHSKNDPVFYMPIVCTFDIETSTLPGTDQAFMYVWQASVNGLVIVGRSWKEYKKFIRKLTDPLPEESRLIIFVHNLSFEFQFLRGVFPFLDDSVFMPAGRKVLKAISGKVEYRCSYLHSNMSLDEYTHKWGVDYAKVHGFDYQKVRYPWTPLTEDEMEYIVGDVIGLAQALTAEMRFDGDTLDSIPLTSTGYVRRELRDNMKQYPKEILMSMQPDLYVFQMLNEAFRGGNCHANRHYSEQILDNVHSVDRSSSYPAVECIEDLYPMGRWKLHKRLVDMEYVMTMIKRHNRCFVARVSIRNLRLRDPGFGCPYLSRDKCRKVWCEREKDRLHMFDNGRILFADYLETTLTDVDLQIVDWEYTGEIKILELASCRAMKLPQPWIDTNLEFYTKKTELKGVPGQEIYYMKAKNKLNAIYGDTVQNPSRIRTVYKNGQYQDDDTALAEALRDAQLFPYKNFAWGVWVAAWARYRLEEVIQMAHHAVDPETGEIFNGFVYSDTDSVKYIGMLPDLEQYNEVSRRRALEAGAVATDPSGRVHYMGEYESEGTYDRFVTLGAKKYAAEKNGKLEITISGVNKKKGAEELGCLENMRTGFTFYDSGGLEAVYNDRRYGFVDVDGRRLQIGKNVCLKPSTYTIGIAEDYRRILNNPDLYLEIFNEKVYSIL